MPLETNYGSSSSTATTQTGIAEARTVLRKIYAWHGKCIISCDPMGANGEGMA